MLAAKRSKIVEAQLFMCREYVAASLVPLAASLVKPLAWAAWLRASVFRPLAQRLDRSKDAFDGTERKETQEFNKERLITRDECKSAPNDERGRHLSA